MPSNTKKPIEKKSIKAKSATVKAAKPAASLKKALTIEVFDIKGKPAGLLELPKELFGVEVNAKLIAQYVRVYLANQRRGTASTKTRGQVQGSTRKIYRQKGTGRARHGSIRAPIFVHGGVAFGPKPRDYSLKLSQKMRSRSLASALSAKLAQGEVKVVAGLEKVEPKTKNVAQILKNLSFDLVKENVLLVLPGADSKKTTVVSVKRAARNLQAVSLVPENILNAYEVLHAKKILFMETAIASMKQRLGEK